MEPTAIKMFVLAVIVALASSVAVVRTEVNTGAYTVAVWVNGISLGMALTAVVFLMSHWATV